jgi:general secretion pathway protein D
VLLGFAVRRGVLVAALLAAALQPAAAPAQPATPSIPTAEGNRTTVTPEGLVNLDFEDVEIAAVIDTIARLSGRNFIYDDRVRGRVTIVSPTPIPVDQAYTVFESVLQVKGFTTVEAPGGVIKVIPIRDAKETSVDTRSRTGATPDTDRFVTRLIPLRYIDSEAISNTLKPLVSKEAALVSYAPTNTVILTDSASNIRRILSILEAIDVETYREELAVIRVQYADATALAEQLSEVFGAEVTSATAQPGAGRVSPRLRRAQAVQPQVPGVEGLTGTQRGQVRIITDERTNALIVLAARNTLDEMRSLIRRLDVPIEGGGRIQVYYLRHADAEELADTLNSLLSGSPSASQAAGDAARAAAAGLQPQQLRAVSELAGAVTSVTADVGTNSLVIQASPEGFEALLRVIEKLDIERPQVLVEALIIEVTVNDSRQLGFNGVLQLVGPDTNLTLQSLTDSTTADAAADLAAGTIAGPTGFIANFLARDGDDIIQAIIRAAENDGDTNILSAPHILTSDNEEAEILVGDNIPIITSRVESAGGITTTDPDDEDTTDQLASSVNVERQDIGVTLRVTPQITEGDSLRLEIFQEITQINPTLQAGVGDVNQVGPALSNRRVENVVVAKDGSTVVIGGLVSDDFSDRVDQIPWFGDIPVLGWLFKTQDTRLQKRNLLVFLTPHIIRSPEDLEKASIGKREEFRRRSEQALGEVGEARDPVPLERPIGILAEAESSRDSNPAARAVAAIERRYPLERMREIEQNEAREIEERRSAAQRAGPKPSYVLLAGPFSDAGRARAALTELVDAGYDGTLVASGAQGRVAYELRIGPYRELAEAERAVETLRRAYDLSPQLVMERSDGSPP